VSMDGRSKYVDLRKHWIPPTAQVDRSVDPLEFDVQPTKKGLWCTLDQWDHFCKQIKVMLFLVPELLDILPCRLSHGDDTAALHLCSTCNPNGYVHWLLNDTDSSTAPSIGSNASESFRS